LTGGIGRADEKVAPMLAHHLFRHHQQWICRTGEPQWIRRTGKPHLLDGAQAILDPEFDWPDETWIAVHFETHDSIGTDPYDSRALFEIPSTT
jgi:hypothetical protein